MSSDLPIPSGYAPPFEVVDDLHHGAWIIIATALGLAIALVSFLIRVYVRVALNPPFAVDDGVLLGATVACPREKLITTSDILYLITIYITKVCVVGIHLRLTPQKRHNQLAWATLALCTAWIVTALFLVTVNCELNRPWKGTGGQCVDLNLDSWDATLASVSMIIWAQVELDYALVACSVFCLRPFMVAVSTNYGTAGDDNLESVSASEQRSERGTHTIRTHTHGDGEREGEGGHETGGKDGKGGPEGGMMGRVLSQEGGLMRWFSRKKRRVSREEIEMDRETGNGLDGGKMVIRKDVQYSVEFKKNSRVDEDAVPNEMEYWDRYLDPRL
ncbi:uncharacterized protein KD926_011520 [Aspergillus affinis]|uniref:uncharacterized protein n=1 Tax=Aspergillus affinis TaxID=1070780 RepID=UPI0022FE227F|nr:uncharacterized protein KD926_011520 [Aspergillus affinis]KAI9037908.1 hypothetical protein KD926_011520 [Aspergillus affinis]